MKWAIVLAILIIVGLTFYYYLNNRKEQSTSWSPSPGELIDSRINLRYIKAFFTSQECQHLISLAKNKFKRSKVVSNTTVNSNSDRTSYSHYLDRQQDLIVKNIEQRVAQTTNVSSVHIEPMQVVRYLEGQEFRPHHDWFHPDYCKNGGKQRRYTFFVYLNSIPEGGETVFPLLDKSFKPVEGDALFWENCTSDTDCNKDSLHQGKSPVGKIKYGLNIWVTLRPYT
jgi:prolyl 4-hydroxylase